MVLCLHIITCLILEHRASYFLLNTFLVPNVLGYFTDLMMFIDITGLGNEKSQGQLGATHFCKLLYIKVWVIF